MEVKDMINGADRTRLKFLHDRVNTADRQKFKAVVRYQQYKAKEL